MDANTTSNSSSTSSTSSTKDADEVTTTASGHDRDDAYFLEQRETSIKRLLAALRRLASDRDDATAATALAIAEELSRISAAPTPHAFQAIYLQLHTQRRRALGTPMAADWKTVYRMAVDVLGAVLWVWRRDMLTARAGPSVPVIGQRILAVSSHCENLANADISGKGE